MKISLIAVLAALAACGKPAPGPEASAPPAGIARGPALTEFTDHGGTFSCRAPSDWKALEGTRAGGPLVTFFGSAADGRAVSISIGRYPDGVDRIRTTDDYLKSLARTGDAALDVSTRTVNGRAVVALHLAAAHGRRAAVPEREDIALISTADGFFEVVHSAPANSYRATLPVFESLVDSFRPKN